VNTLVSAVSSEEHRFLTGKYRVAVEALLPSGEATGSITEVLAAPDPEDLAAALHVTVDTMPRLERLSFVGGLPGEIVDVEVSWALPRQGKKPSRHAPAPWVRIIDILQSSPDRQVPRCAVFGICGGCQLQHMDYATQLHWKRERVRDALLSANVAEVDPLPTIACTPPWGYRNHMRFSVNRRGQAGLTARGSHKVLPLISCPIAHPEINVLLSELTQDCLPQPQLMVRYAEGTRQILTQPPLPSHAESLLSQRDIAVRHGDMEEQLAGETFHIRPSSFFQTNSRQAERMAALVLEHLTTKGGGTLVDAYCGVGTFARLLARHARKVIAIEESASAVRDARANLNDLENVDIIQGKVEDILPRLSERIDGLVIDPPRAGCYPTVLEALRARRIPRVVYVSCNPDTLARDLNVLTRPGGYHIVSVQPLDMFPQTVHIESVTLLESVQ